MRHTDRLAVLIVGFGRESAAAGAANVNVMLSGVSKYAAEAGLEAVTYLVDGLGDPLVGYCRERGLEGVVVFGAQFDNDNFLELAASDIVAVAMDIPLSGPGKGCVRIDDFTCARLAVERLLDGGSRNVAMLDGSRHAHVAVERAAGYRAALEARGLPVHERWIADADFDMERGRRAAHELLDAFPEIDGFFCASDYMGVGCHHALLERGVDIPGEIQIIGFDGTVAAQMVYPTLATIRQDGFQKGFEAARLLHQLLEGEDAAHTVTLPCRLIERDSVRPPRG